QRHTGRQGGVCGHKFNFHSIGVLLCFSFCAFGKILGTVHNDRPETLLASALAFPAKVIVRYPPSFIEEEGQFQLPLFRHSRHGASLNKNPPISAVTAAIDG